MQSRLLALMALPLFAASAGASAQPAGALTPGQQSLLQLAPVSAPIAVSATADRADGRYAVGDPVAITVAADEDAYVYLFDIDAGGVVTLLYPNAHAPGAMLKAGERRVFPAPDDPWQVVADRPGIQLVKVIATRSANGLIGATADPAGPFKVFRAAGADLAHSLRAAVDAEDARWGETSLRLTVGGGNAPVPPPALTEADLRPRNGPLDRLPSALPPVPIIPPSLF